MTYGVHLTRCDGTTYTLTFSSVVARAAFVAGLSPSQGYRLTDVPDFT